MAYAPSLPERVRAQPPLPDSAVSGDRVRTVGLTDTSREGQAGTLQFLVPSGGRWVVKLDTEEIPIQVLPTKLAFLD